MLNVIYKVLDIPTEKIHNVFLFGSRIYQTVNSTSDYDFIVIVSDDVIEQEIQSLNLNIHTYHIDTYKQLLSECDIGAIESLLSPVKLKEDVVFTVSLNNYSLRKAISSTVSNSWVKCFKKIDQGDYYIGIKSLFHSLRIAMFGIQLAKHGTILDFSCANHIYYELMSKTWSSKELKETYQPLRNSLMTEFRSQCPVI